METTALPHELGDWIGGQRWYAGKGTRPQLREVARWTLPPVAGLADDADCVVHLVLDEGIEPPVLYQIPLSYRTEPAEALAHARVSTAHRSSDDPAPYVYDAPHDPAFAQRLFEFIAQGLNAESSESEGSITAHGHPVHQGDERLHVSSSMVLSGEQSNTSVIFELADADGVPAPPAIVKIFRALHDGENPDIVLQTALHASGCTQVPAPLGSISAEWPGPVAGTRSRGHLAFAQEFLPGVQDAWRVALASIEAGEEFTAQAYELGVATARVHVALAAAMPGAEATPERRAAQLASMARRYFAAAAEVPAISVHQEEIEQLYARAEAAQWPRLQAVHGDYHLGQVLSVPGRGWLLLDFEGEPLRPMDERTEPDLALRDVAGMLRSFDYAGGSFDQSWPGQTGLAWAQNARAAFIAGYESESGIVLSQYQAVLDALELDKAVYEVVYEARNRPDWLPIPTAAIDRLLK